MIIVFLQIVITLLLAVSEMYFIVAINVRTAKPIIFSVMSAFLLLYIFLCRVVGDMHKWQRIIIVVGLTC